MDKKEKQQKHLTHDELSEKAFELGKKYNCKIEPIEFFRDGEQIVGFIRTPNRMLKARTMDSATTQGTITAAGTLFEAILVREESDPRFSSDKSEDDDVYFGGALASFAKIEILTNQFTKK